MPVTAVGSAASPLELNRLALPVRPVAEPDRRPFPQVAQLSLRLTMFRHILARALPTSCGHRLLDLGCGPGHFARLAARHGFQVTALDARPPWAVTGKGRPAPVRGFPFAFIQSDVRDFTAYDAFDVVLCIGLLYHLPLAEQQRLLSRCLGRPMLVDTELFDPALLPSAEAGRFTTVACPGGYDGALCAETGDAWSSYGNRSSFWPAEHSILRMFADTGWTRVTVIDPAYRSPFGLRRWFLLHPPAPDPA